MSSFSQDFAGVSTFIGVKQKAPVLTKRKKTLNFGLKMVLKKGKRWTLWKSHQVIFLTILSFVRFREGGGMAHWKITKRARFSFFIMLQRLAISNVTQLPPFMINHDYNF